MGPAREVNDDEKKKKRSHVSLFTFFVIEQNIKGFSRKLAKI